MSKNVFRLQEHIIPGQHIREYPHAITDQEGLVQLAVKQYTPLDNLEPSPGDITIIGTHANGFPKELYEPLWDEIHALSKKAGFKIRNIWIADVAWQGISSVLNESITGNDPGWYDHVRDLMGMVNIFRNEMKRPIFGIGHSMGANQLVNLALSHPRLLEGLILMDPVISRATSPKMGMLPAKMSAIRRDKWPSRKVALENFKKSKFYQVWDPRVLDLWVQYGLRDLPTKLYPNVLPSTEPYNPETNEVTLTTTKHQEVFTFLRHTSPAAKANLDSFTEEEKAELKRILHADMLGFEKQTEYRAELPETFSKLPNLRPSVLYLFGGTSYLSGEDARAEKMAATGVGSGGSGGVNAGRVKEIVVKDTGHLIPMEKVNETAQFCAEWLASENQRFKREDSLIKRFHAAQTDREKFTLSNQTMSRYEADMADLMKGRQKRSKSKI